MINLLITIFLLALVFGLVFWLVQSIPLPEPWGQIMRICAVLICLLVLVSVLFGGMAPRFTL